MQNHLCAKAGDHRERAEERDVRGARRGSHEKKEGSQKLPKHAHWEFVK